MTNNLTTIMHRPQIRRLLLTCCLLTTFSQVAGDEPKTGDPAHKRLQPPPQQLSQQTPDQLPPPLTYQCNFTHAAPVIDGKLDEKTWRHAPWSEPFVDIEGASKPLPRHATRMKMLWDAKHLYIAANLNEPHIQASLTGHDAVIFHDNDFEVFIDPDGDNRNYFEFEINALDTGWDLFLDKPYRDGGTADNAWSISNLRTAVSLRGTINNPSDRDDGWSVEIAIPWSAFNYRSATTKPPASGDTWRMNFSRVQWRFDIIEGAYRKPEGIKEDNWVWSPQGIINMHAPERWGFVRFSNLSRHDQTAPKK